MIDSNIEIKTIISRFCIKGIMFFPVGASENEIKEFENKHNIVLPLILKKWLMFTDGGELFLPAGVQLYGVSHTPMIDVNDDDRLDDTYIVIGRLASGDPILLSKESEQIAIYNHELGKIEADEIYSNFLSFLNDLEALLGVDE